MIEFTLNGKQVRTEVEPDTPLLWVVRDEFKLKGTKFGCGIAMCGACTLHLDGNAVRSCSLPVSMADEKNITTIEGLSNAHLLQEAWIEHQVPQCGYCQSGQIMQTAMLLQQKSNPSDGDIVAHMSAKLCRCMAYSRIKDAIKTAAKNSTNTGVNLFDPNAEKAFVYIHEVAVHPRCANCHGVVENGIHRPTVGEFREPHPMNITSLNNVILTIKDHHFEQVPNAAMTS